MSKKSDPNIVAVDRWRANVAAVLVDDDGCVLLGVAGSHSPYYHFPQGGVRRGETMLEAVLRELREETGLCCDGVRAVARYGGLRYRYRSKNRKSERWEGQEQTYFLLRWHGTFPQNLPSASPEFVRLLSLPWHELEPSLFVPFKQEVVAAVLSHFFPSALRQRGASQAEFESYWSLSCHTTRYWSRAGQRPRLKASAADDERPPAETGVFGADAGDAQALFGGGKEEAEGLFADAQRELQQLQRRASKRGESLIVLALGLPGCGRRSMLRQLGRCLDPLRLAVGRARPECAGELPAERLASLSPEPGSVLLLLNSPYDTLLRDEESASAWCRNGSLTAKASELLAALDDAEQSLRERGLRVLRLFLNERPSSGEHRPSGHCGLPDGKRSDMSPLEVSDSENDADALFAGLSEPMELGDTFEKSAFDSVSAEADEPDVPCADEAEESSRCEMLEWASRLMEDRDWLVLPSTRRWYRNLVCVRAVAEALGSP